MTHKIVSSIHDTIAAKKTAQVRLMEAEFAVGAQRIKVLESQLAELNNVGPGGKWANLNEQTIKHIQTKILAEQMRLLDLNTRIEAIQPSFTYPTQPVVVPPSTHQDATPIKPHNPFSDL
jgi:uncharacterized protein YigA (DUF484 family)